MSQMKTPKECVSAWRAGVRYACRTLVEQGWPQSTILPELLALVIMEINKDAAAHLATIEKLAHREEGKGEDKLDSNLRHFFSEGGRFVRDTILERNDLILAFVSDDVAYEDAQFVMDATHKEADERFGKAE
jgi:hypothetical protein